jgi:hypothetical protein
VTKNHSQPALNGKTADFLKNLPFLFFFVFGNAVGVSFAPFLFLSQNNARLKVKAIHFT